jgi:hypothetical protein
VLFRAFPARWPLFWPRFRFLPFIELGSGEASPATGISQGKPSEANFQEGMARDRCMISGNTDLPVAASLGQRSARRAPAVLPRPGGFRRDVLG